MNDNSSSRIQVVIFDLDDTLYPEWQYVRGGFRAVGDYLQKRLSRGEPFAQWLWMRFLGGTSRGALDALNEHFKLGLTADGIAELLKVYRCHVPSLEPYDGLPDFLGRLREYCKLAVLSDGYLPGQRLKFEALGLARFFDEVLFTEDLGRQCWKPSPRGYLLLQEKFAADPAACAYVGDNPAKDFVAPNALGWRTIQFLRPGQVHAALPAAPGGSPQSIARSIDELRAILLSA